MSTQAAVPNPTEQIDQNISGVPTDAVQKPASADGAQPANDGENEHPEDGHGREGGYQRVKRQRDEARAREEYWRDRAQNGADPKPAAAAPAVVEEPEPKEEDFATVSEYLKAVRAFDRKQIVKEVQSLQSKTEQERSAQSEHQKRVSAYNERAAAFATEKPDFDEKLKNSEHIKVTPAMEEAIIESENGPALAYFFATNEEEATRIAALGPLAAARAIGKIEARLAKEEPATEPEKQVPAITAAPRPLSTSSRPSSSTPAFDPMDPKSYKSYEEFEKAMNEREKKKQKG